MNITVYLGANEGKDATLKMAVGGHGPWVWERGKSAD